MVIVSLLSVLLFAACDKAAEAPKGAQSTPASDLPTVTVYKSPTCGCCTEWEVHLRMKGFRVISHKTDDMIAIKKKHGLTRNIASCHTALIGGYVIEGHVPASDIKRLLKEKPDVLGLTAPGMPQESPGMQPHDKKPRNYKVLTFDKEGKTTVFTSY